MTPSKPIPASIVIPTRSRAAYLEVALSSIAPQAGAAGAEVLVIDDAGPSPEGLAQAERFGARYEPLARPRGLNVARNTGVQRSGGELVVFVDDDVQAGPGWLQALLTAAREHPDVDVFAGPIRPRLEGRSGWGSHSCGREGAPITTLDLGGSDVDARYAWGANMAIRREALERVGAFEESLEHGGDEQEWQDRLRARDPGARVLYVAEAGVDHRRAGPDAQLRGLARAQYTRGRAARRFDARRGQAPSLAARAGDARGLHVACRPPGLSGGADDGRAQRRACTRSRARARRFRGCLVVERDAGGRRSCGQRRGSRRQPRGRRRREPKPQPKRRRHGRLPVRPERDRWRHGRNPARMRDHGSDAWEIASARRLRLDLAARHEPPLRRVLAIGVVRPEHAALAQSIRAELLRSRHEVELRTCPPGGLGKFENLNRLLAERGVGRQSRSATGCSSSTTTSSCRGASSTGCCSCASASSCSSPSPRTGEARTRRGR